MKGLHLVHDVQDAQLHDRKHRNIGRVDGLVLEFQEGRPLRVATILVGGPIRDERIGRWVLGLTRLLRKFARMKSDGVSQIPFSAVREISHCVEVDVDGQTLESEHLERWLCENVVRRVPGSRGGRK
jgi:hypothetical protein